MGCGTFPNVHEGAEFMTHRLGRRVASYAGYSGGGGDWQAQGDRIMGMDYDDWLQTKVAFGAPEMVADRLRQLQKELALTHIVYEIDLGNHLSYDLQLNSLRLFN